MEKIKAKIKAVASKKIDSGFIGFLTTESNKWVNVKGEKNELTEILKIVKKGNIIGFDFSNGVANNISLEAEAEADNSNQEMDLISFEELLDDATGKGIKSIRTELIQADFEKKNAIFKAIVTMKTGEFEAHGDATQENAGTLVGKHWLRMAETRAIARALRWATNNAKTSIEEI